MATYIKEKHELIDLATYGSKARKEMHPKVLIGGSAGEQRYVEGDILDANATVNLIKDLTYGFDETALKFEDGSITIEKLSPDVVNEIENAGQKYALSEDYKEWLDYKILEDKQKLAQELFSVSTEVTGTTQYTVDVTPEAYITVIVRTKFCDTLVTCDTTPEGWVEYSTGVYTKSVSSIHGSAALIESAQFTYTCNFGEYFGITVNGNSEQKNIRIVKPFYYGWYDTDDQDDVLLAVKVLTRVASNTGSGTFKQAPSGTKYFWMIVPNDRTAQVTQLQQSIVRSAIISNDFNSPENENISLSLYKIYISKAQFSRQGDINWVVS